MAVKLQQQNRDRLDASGVAPRFRSPLRYPGGKQKALRLIEQLLPEQVTEYREPMVGGGSVYLLARSKGMAQKYWINDMFEELADFWRTVQDVEQCARMMSELHALMKRFRNADQIKRYFYKAREEEAQDAYRAAFLFFFFNRVTFSGTTRAGGFSSAASIARFTPSSVQRLSAMPEALRDTSITNVDFEQVIEAKGTDVFLFLDPPYFNATRLYGRNGALHDFDHERLASALRKSAHRFLITYDDCPAIRSLYSWARIDDWRLQYGMNNCNQQNLSKIGAELFIRNY
jgi:DNA adenine methylase